MIEDDFIKNYLKPSINGLDQRFTHNHPPIDDLKPSGDFIFQVEQDSTVSTNILLKQTSDKHALRLVEVYKNTENTTKGVFVRLVGTLSVVKKGCHFLFLDAAVTNVSPITAAIEPITTRVAVHVPQSESRARSNLFHALSAVASRTGISTRELELETTPEFWGPIWLAESKKLDLELIAKLRNAATANYLEQCSSNESETGALDLSPVQDHMIKSAARREHLLFAKMGLAVPIEAQATFFGVMTGMGEL